MAELKGLPLESGSFDLASRTFTVCKECYRCVLHTKLPACALANRLWLGPVPPELQDLTVPERLLISPVRIKIYIVKLRASVGPGTEQSALKGQSIAFPQNVPAIYTMLPAPLSTLPESLKVRRSHFRGAQSLAVRFSLLAPANRRGRHRICTACSQSVVPVCGTPWIGSERTIPCLRTFPWLRTRWLLCPTILYPIASGIQP